MGRDGVPLDEVSSLMSRTSHPKDDVNTLERNLLKPTSWHLMLTCGCEDSCGGREKFRIFRKATVAGHICILSPATPLSTHWSIEVAHLSPGRCGLVGNLQQNGITLFSTAREKVGEVRHALGLTKHNNIDIQFGPRFIPTSHMSQQWMFHTIPRRRRDALFP